MHDEDGLQNYCARVVMATLNAPTREIKYEKKVTKTRTVSPTLRMNSFNGVFWDENSYVLKVGAAISSRQPGRPTLRCTMLKLKWVWDVGTFERA